MKRTVKKKFFKYGVIIFSVILLFSFSFCVIYVNDYYHADIEAISVFKNDSLVSKEILNDNTIVYSADNANSAFIFYPGGKVEYTAYEPLMISLANKGIMCVLIDMPFNLAIFDINAADGIQAQFPEINKWYIGGHSLGGSMAAMYLKENANLFDGLILLASYSTVDLADTKLDVISIYGSKDNILNMNKYNENKINLPNDFSELIIEGGCHAYFGMYGKQDGDGSPTITNEEQILKTAKHISNFIFQ